MKKDAIILHKIFDDKRTLMLAAACVTVFVVLITAWTQKRVALDSAQQLWDTKKQQLVEAEMVKAELEFMIDSEGAEAEYIERKARDDLDMVLPGERVYIISDGN